jgi:undecaprenyl pyrophosphate phosphatase UppP
MDRGKQRQRRVRTAWTAVIAALVLGFILVPALDAVGALLLAPKMHAVAARVFAGVLWAALVGAAWTYQPSSHG